MSLSFWENAFRLIHHVSVLPFSRTSHQVPSLCSSPIHFGSSFKKSDPALRYHFIHRGFISIPAAIL